MDPHVELTYLSAGCNLCPHTVDWGLNNVLCYASKCSIILRFETVPEGSHRYLTLVGHKERVNSVRWIKRHKDLPEEDLISTSVDNTSILWTKNSNLQETENLYSLNILKGHSGAVSVADGLQIQDKYYMVSASADSSIRVWIKTADSEASCNQVISLGSGFALDVKTSILPNTSVPLFAAATDEAKILLYFEQDGTFLKLHTLTGHEDWVRALDFTITENNDLLLASAGQDCLIRLWRIYSQLPEKKATFTSIAELSADEEITLKGNRIEIQDKNETLVFGIVLESIMAGHENWIYGVHWQPRTKKKDGTQNATPCLLSSSMDKTVILWVPTQPTGLWLEEVRLGDVGGNLLGFYGCKFNGIGDCILAHGFQGSFHIWQYHQELKRWCLEVPLGGHYNEVCDLVWDPEGRYILSTSSDQTTRLHAPWLKNDDSVSWHEIARPQIHGYDMTCLCAISSFQFVSGADEKILRVFTAPKTFLRNFKTICRSETSGDLNMDLNSLPEGAAVPALSLSNKAVFQSDDLKEIADERLTESTYIPLQMERPPTEEDLLRSTLWPESKKLYGHGFEIFCVASNHKGNYIASACKASKPMHATIILWEVGTWEIIAELEAHALTVTQLAFSPDDQYLLSVSRDRTWALFRELKIDGQDTLFEKVAYTDKETSIHTRIIWSCAWTHDSKYFATCSRDKKVIVWGKSNEEQKAKSCLGDYFGCAPLTLNNSVTAVAFGCESVNSEYLLAMGLESGMIQLHTWKPISDQESIWNHCYTFSESLGHHLSVQRLRFRPKPGIAGELNSLSTKGQMQLASCGKDNAVRIFTIKIN